MSKQEIQYCKHFFLIVTIFFFFFEDTDFDIILEDILYKEVLKIYRIEKKKKSSATTKSKSNTKDIDYKLSDVSVCDPSNSREGQNDTDLDIKIEDILYKELIKIYSIEWNKESSATTKSKSNTKDIDYKLSDVTIRDPHNSREGQNGVYVLIFLQLID
ncbi:hypothetical protein CDAR_91381 [Caerostris darwini]|uniref:Uncharacterized protein n=1 Tax=Caerostris darwini TaxID=1538125 RepID=A0AAV4VSU7_9ARAC|nr:hypothetical protein CDAR_91381 [Caerostris darwini]